MKIFQIITLMVLTASATFAMQDAPTLTEQETAEPQMSRLATHPQTMEELIPVAMKLVQELKVQNKNLRKQLGLQLDSYFKIPRLSHSQVPEDSLETEAESVIRICTDFERWTLDIVLNLNNENKELEKLLTQKNEQIVLHQNNNAGLADSSIPFEVQRLMLALLDDQALSTASTVCHQWTIVTETLFREKSPIQSPLRLDMWPKKLLDALQPTGFRDALQTNQIPDDLKKSLVEYQPSKHSYYLRQGLWDTVTYLDTRSTTTMPKHVTTYAKFENFAQYCGRFNFCAQSLSRFAFHGGLSEEHTSTFNSILKSWSDHYLRDNSSSPKPPSPATISEVFLASRPTKKIATLFGQGMNQVETYHRGFAAGLCGHFNFLITEGCPDIVDYYATKLGVPTQINLAAYYINNVHDIDEKSAQEEANRYLKILNPISCLYFDDHDFLNIGLGQFGKYKLIGVDQLMPNLTELHFPSWKGETDKDSTEYLVTLPTITKLCLYRNCTVTNRMVREMTQLTSLNLDGNEFITGDTVQSLTRLTELSIKNNPLITDGVLRTMPNLHTIQR